MNRKQAVIIYVWILPFTLVAMLGWITIPIVVLVGFILFGVESIGNISFKYLFFY